MSEYSGLIKSFQTSIFGGTGEKALIEGQVAKGLHTAKFFGERAGELNAVDNDLIDLSNAALNKRLTDSIEKKLGSTPESVSRGRALLQKNQKKLQNVITTQGNNIRDALNPLKDLHNSLTDQFQNFLHKDI